MDGVWARLLAGQSGAGRIEKFQTDDLPCQIAAEVPRAGSERGAEFGDNAFNPDDWMDKKEQRRVDDFIIFGMAAADMALADSGLELKTEEQKYRAGVMIGSGVGGLDGIAEASITLENRGPKKISPFFIPGRLINLVSGQVSIKHGLKGPNHAVVTALFNRRSCHRRCGADGRL